MAHLRNCPVYLVRFGEALGNVQSQLDSNNFYLYNPEIGR